MQDIWQHLALADVLHNYDIPGSIYPEYFILPTTPKPNLAYYYLIHYIGFITPSLEFANKVVLSGYVLLFPTAFLYLLRSFGRSRWLGFFAFPFIYSSMFAYGFVSFIMALPLMFFGIGAYRRFVASPDEAIDVRAGVIASFAILATFFTHAHVFLLLGLLGGIIFLLHTSGWWGTLRRLAPFVPGLTVFVPWFVVYFLEQTSSASGMHFGSVGELFGSTFYKPSVILSSFFFYVGDYFRVQWDDVVFLLTILIAIVLLMLRRHPEIPPTQTRKLKYYDLEILTVILLITVVLFPQHIESQSIVSMRHLLPAVLFFFGWLGFDDAPKRVAVPAIITLIVLHLVGQAFLVRSFHDFEDELDGYTELFDQCEGGKRLLKVTYNQESSVTNHGALWHMHFFYTILKGGISDLQFAEYPHNPIQYRPGMVPPRTGVEFTRNRAWRFYDYVLLRKRSLPNIKSITDYLEIIGENRGWLMYKVIEWPKPRSEIRDTIAMPRRSMLNSEWQSNPLLPKEDSHEHKDVGEIAVPGIGRIAPLSPDVVRERLRGDGGVPRQRGVGPLGGPRTGTKRSGNIGRRPNDRR